MFLKVVFYFLLFFSVGCQSSSLENYHRRGCEAILDLSKDLHEIQSLDDLNKKSSKLKKKMRRLTALMIEVDDYSRSHPQEQIEKEHNDLESDRLRYEMLRICEEIEGARGILEAMQDEMLDKLDLHERKIKKL